MKPLYKEKYPLLFTPLIVGKNKVEYKNRIFQAPMGMALGTDANGLINIIGEEYYSSFARGGFAQICLPIEVPKDGGHPRTYSIDEQNHAFMNMHKLQRVVHAYGARSSCEIYHAGCCMTPGPGRTIMSASAFVYNGRQVKEMDDKDMEDVAQMYAHAAFMVKRAGFDAITLHYGHGWLMNNFLSPLTNHRTDEFGGSVENRCRYPLMIMKRIRQEVGNDLVIEVRMNGSDMMEGGITPEDAAEQALILSEEADMLHMTCGTRLDASSRPKMHPTHFLERAHNARASELAKKAGVKIPVGVVGSIHDPDLAERLLEEGKADYVLTARQALTDSDFVNKIREGRLEDIRPCLRCDFCLDGSKRGALTTEVNIRKDSTYDRQCAVNPLWYQGITKKHLIPMPSRKRKVVVVGGGIAGMQAAFTAAERGHDVTLYEKSDKLGGQALFSDGMWFKQEMKAFREYLIRQVHKSGVHVLMNTEATPKLISEIDPDVAIIAVGAEQIVPRIPGIDGKNVFMSWDVFGHYELLGKRVAIVGGGLVGCELSIDLAGQGHDVTVVELGHYLAATAQISERMHIMEFMKKNNVTAMVDTTVESIEPDHLNVRTAEGLQTIEADSFIICTGTRSLADLRDSFRDTAFDVINIGDCVRASDIVNAVRTGWDAGATV